MHKALESKQYNGKPVMIVSFCQSKAVLLILEEIKPQAPFFVPTIKNCFP